MTPCGRSRTAVTASLPSPDAAPPGLGGEPQGSGDVGAVTPRAGEPRGSGDAGAMGRVPAPAGRPRRAGGLRPDGGAMSRVPTHVVPQLRLGEPNGPDSGLPAVPVILHPELVHTSGATPGSIESSPCRAGRQTTEGAERPHVVSPVDVSTGDVHQLRLGTTSRPNSDLSTVPELPEPELVHTSGETPVRHRVDHPVPRGRQTTEGAERPHVCHLSASRRATCTNSGRGTTSRRNSGLSAAFELPEPELVHAMGRQAKATRRRRHATGRPRDGAHDDGGGGARRVARDGAAPP
mgnify:CR=1 FL=1